MQQSTVCLEFLFIKDEIHEPFADDLDELCFVPLIASAVSNVLTGLSDTLDVP